MQSYKKHLFTDIKTKGKNKILLFPDHSEEKNQLPDRVRSDN
ncbi:hypothetical protein HMPREF1981_03252 [Bacteroides pyogenes F0041]|uniref:Uncharacterized protein n=1 Tax=Bacteroides pyogenes F0041 TaxID=1321819 RepID=U2DNW3_9BACE|nr:hypothetical protein HMPREF1981_03252 [Bacteroides pyogenes F0041]